MQIEAVAPGNAPYPVSAQITVQVQTAATPSAFGNNWTTLSPVFDYSQTSPYTYLLPFTQLQNSQPYMQVQFNLVAGQDSNTINLPQLLGVNVARRCIYVGGG